MEGVLNLTTPYLNGKHELDKIDHIDISDIDNFITINNVNIYKYFSKHIECITTKSYNPIKFNITGCTTATNGEIINKSDNYQFLITFLKHINSNSLFLATSIRDIIIKELFDNIQGDVIPFNKILSDFDNDFKESMIFNDFRKGSCGYNENGIKLTQKLTNDKVNVPNIWMCHYINSTIQKIANNPLYQDRLEITKLEDNTLSVRWNPKHGDTMMIPIVLELDNIKALKDHIQYKSLKQDIKEIIKKRNQIEIKFGIIIVNNSIDIKHI